MAKYTYEEVKNIFAQHDMTLVSTKYHNRDEKLEYICNNHPQKGIQKMSLCGLQQGQKCVYCRYYSDEPCNFVLPEDIYADETEKLGYKYVSFHKEKSFIYIDFICPEHRGKGTQSAMWHYIKNGTCCCSSCNGNDRSTQDFINLLQSKNPQVDVIGKYLGARKSVDVKCSVCGYEWSPLAYNLLSGCGCPNCYNNRRGELHHVADEEKLKKLEEIHPDIEFLEVPYYAKDNVKCKCKTCGHIWEATYINLTKSDNPTGCPRCIDSKGEKLIQSLLTEWGYKYTSQKKFDDLKDSSYLPFDIYLDDFNVLIEYDGIQHYSPTQFGGISEDRAKDLHDLTKKHDKMKNEYCKKNNIPLIRIPYWKQNDIEYYLFNELTKLHVIEEI